MSQPAWQVFYKKGAQKVERVMGVVVLMMEMQPIFNHRGR